MKLNYFILIVCISLVESVADPQSLLEEKEALEEKLALTEYELRLAQEDIVKLKTELEKKSENPVHDDTDGKYISSLLIRLFV